MKVRDRVENIPRAGIAQLRKKLTAAFSIQHSAFSIQPRRALGSLGFYTAGAEKKLHQDYSCQRLIASAVPDC
jgi:hypothetical protein